MMSGILILVILAVLAPVSLALCQYDPIVNFVEQFKPWTAVEQAMNDVTVPSGLRFAMPLLGLDEVLESGLGTWLGQITPPLGIERMSASLAGYCDFGYASEGTSLACPSRVLYHFVGGCTGADKRIVRFHFNEDNLVDHLRETTTLSAHLIGQQMQCVLDPQPEPVQESQKKLLFAQAQRFIKFFQSNAYPAGTYQDSWFSNKDMWALATDEVVFKGASNAPIQGKAAIEQFWRDSMSSLVKRTDVVNDVGHYSSNEVLVQYTTFLHSACHPDPLIVQSTLAFTFDQTLVSGIEEYFGPEPEMPQRVLNFLKCLHDEL